MSGSTSYHAGLAAEDSVSRHYRRCGHDIVAQRWRCGAGEIDLIAKDGNEIIFVEVKTSRSFDGAAQRVSARQMQRIAQSAEMFLGDQPEGTDTPSRFDVALVDGQGEIRIIENAFGA